MLCLDRRRSSVYLSHDEILRKDTKTTEYRVTPVIVTFYEGVLTDIDIKNLIESGLQMVRLRMTHIARQDKIILMDMLKQAQHWVCQKYDVSSWPIAICIDIPNATVRSGYVADDINDSCFELELGSIIDLTSDVKYWKNCTQKRIFIDDRYTLPTLNPGTEITVGKTKLTCLEVVDKKTIKCKVTLAGLLSGNEYVKYRGVQYKRPPLTKFDLQLLEFAREFKLDILIVFGVRYSTTIKKIKKLTEDFKPLILSTICDQEGLDNIDSIITATDGILLAREFLNDNLVNRYSLPAIQLQVCGKCKVAGKPFFISGDILQQTLNDATISSGDISDITNAVFQGAGFILPNYSNASNAVKAMRLLDSVCKTIERAEKIDEFWRIIDVNLVPQNAAVACVAACAVLARQSTSKVVIIPTVTGKTAIQLSQVASSAMTIAISKSPAVARKLQMYRGIYTIIYDKPPKDDWDAEINARVHFAVMYAMKKDILDYKDTYVTLRKSQPSSSFCDSVGLWRVNSMKQTSADRCEDTSDKNIQSLQTIGGV